MVPNPGRGAVIPARRCHHRRVQETGASATPRRVRGAATVAGLVLAVTPLTAGCSFFGDDDGGTSVMDVAVGQCFLAPEEVAAQIDDLDEVDCGEPHDREAYATPTYDVGDSSKDSDAFPGDETLAKFAQGACAEEFGPYVGVDYLDSELFFTYLTPSARSWQDGDRTVLCFVVGTGQPLVGSIKGKAI